MTTKKTIREKIYKLMTTARSWEEIEGRDSEYYTNEILKIFEKLIDEKIEWSNSTPKNKLDKAIKNKEIDEIFYRGFHEGFDEALKQLKAKLNKK